MRRAAGLLVRVARAYEFGATIRTRRPGALAARARLLLGLLRTVWLELPEKHFGGASFMKYGVIGSIYRTLLRRAKFITRRLFFLGHGEGRTGMVSLIHA